MPLTSVLYLFLAHLGIGICLTLLLVSREVGVKFFRFNAGLAVILLVIALAFRPDAGPGHAPTVAVSALVIATAALGIYWSTVGRMWAAARPWLLGTATVAGVLALGGQSAAVALDATFLPGALIFSSFLTSAALLGGACTAMILGHWYLILPSMSVAHLQWIVGLHIGSLILRIMVVAAAVTVAVVGWEPGDGPSFWAYIWSVDGIFFWQRILFGLLGPMLLAYLTWETAKISSTQSATGILYVDLFTVVVGEVLAKYLLLSTAVPV